MESQTLQIQSEIFGSRASQVIAIARRIIPQLSCTTQDFPLEVHQMLTRSSPEESLQLYWLELLSRVYVASAGSLIRYEQWIDAMNATYRESSYLGFCAALRGLVESAADSMYSLEVVPDLLVEHFAQIKCILAGESFNQPVVCKEFEDRLIHFVHARNVSRGEAAPENHKALRNRDYIVAP